MAKRSVSRWVALAILFWTSIVQVKLAFVPAARKPYVQSLVVASRPLHVGCRFFGDFGAPAKAEISDLAPQWDDLQGKLEELQTPEEKVFRQNLVEGRGQANAMANLRVFKRDADESGKVTLYRDSASWCPYCHKVWMLLEEKEIPYNVQRVNMKCYGEKPIEFIEMQPNGQIPVARVEGYGTLRSSDEIIQTLLNIPGSSPEIDSALDPFDDPQSVTLLGLERELFGRWLQWLCGGSSSRSSFELTLKKVEDALNADSSGPYFLGQRFSLIDIMYTPFLERAEASLAYFKGFNIRDREKYPAISNWFEAMETRPSYRASKSDYYTHAHDLPPQLGGCREEASGAQARADIDGVAWKLPGNSKLTEPDWGWISPDQARREAAERMIHNPESIVQFAARGASSPGFPPVWAELADPNAKPAMEWIPSIDAMLRHATALLLASSGDITSSERTEAWASAKKTIASIPESSRGDLVKCLEYLQRRIGVPRDMSLPAANCLRSELGKLIDEIQS